MILIKYLRRERASAGLARAAVGTAVAQKEERPRDAAAQCHAVFCEMVVKWCDVEVVMCCTAVRMSVGGNGRRPPEGHHQAGAFSQT